MDLQQRYVVGQTGNFSMMSRRFDDKRGRARMATTDARARETDECVASHKDTRFQATRIFAN
jgi:hypothetical protein